MFTSNHSFKSAQEFLHYTAHHSTTAYCLIPLCQSTRSKLLEQTPNPTDSRAKSARSSQNSLCHTDVFCCTVVFKGFRGLSSWEVSDCYRKLKHGCLSNTGQVPPPSLNKECSCNELSYADTGASIHRCVYF